METVVLIIMLMVSFNFALKTDLSQGHRYDRHLHACRSIRRAGMALCRQPVKTQIADWLNAPDLMLDTSVILTVDVFSKSHSA